MLNRYLLTPLAALALLAATSRLAQAQTGGVRIGTAGAPDPSAALDISSTTQGLLLPRLSLAQRTALTSSTSTPPVVGLVIYQTDNTPGLYAYDGAAWVRLGGGGDNLGNHTATQALNLGANPLVGNGGSTGLTIGSTGNVGIGTTAPPAQKLDVVGNVRVGTAGNAGKVLTNTTGTSNMLAAAYGQSGNNSSAVYGGSGNYSVVIAGLGVYTITFPASSGLSGTNFDYLTVNVSLYGASPGFITWSGGTGTITVRTFGMNGAASSAYFFSFAVFVP